MTVRRGRASHGSMISDLFTFALFAMFLLLSLLVVVIGVDVYRSVINDGETVGAVRTSLGYVAGKVRSEAAADGVLLEERAGVPVIVLVEEYEGARYETIIYHQDGALYEAYINADENDFSPDFGERLAEIDVFDASWAADNLLALTSTAADGTTQTLHLALRAAQEVTE